MAAGLLAQPLLGKANRLGRICLDNDGVGD